MNLDNSTNAEELQRQVQALSQAQVQALTQALHARNSDYEQLVQSQFRGDPSTLNHIAQNYSLAQAGYQFPGHGVAGARSSGLSRSKSTISYPTQIKSAITERQVGLHAHKRERRAYSQQSNASVSMSRSISAQSESHMPFVQTGSRIAPLNPSINRFCESQDEPANQSLQGASERLPSVQEHQPLLGVGMDPAEFLKMCPETPQQFDLSFSNFPYNMAPANDFSSLSGVPSSYPMTSGCPSMISGPSVTEAASPLTRQNSAMDNFGVSMAPMESSQSHADALFAPDLSPSPTNIFATGKQHTSEQDLIGLGANLSSAAAAQQWASANRSSLLTSLESTDMERSVSNTSISSARSTASNVERRAKEARERILLSAQTKLAPKPKEEIIKAEANSGASKKEVKVPVNKSSYQRPKHPKVHCDQCNEHPDGFRGDHELRRHISAKHEGFVKKFVCRDPATVGIKSNVTAVNPLSKCKACTSGKEYGAYYNAAAHLRRTHFKPKTPRGKKGANADEKRGGKGGGDWPSMTELKAWFVEKTVEISQNESPITDTEEGDSDMADTEMEGSSLPNQMEMYGIGSSMSPFETNYDLALEGTDPGMLAGPNTELSIQAPISSAGSFGYSPFSDGSPLTGLSDNYAFSEQSASAYGSNLSSTNTITPTTYQEISQLGLSENVWA